MRTFPRIRLHGYQDRFQQGGNTYNIYIYLVRISAERIGRAQERPILRVLLIRTLSRGYGVSMRARATYFQILGRLTWRALFFIVPQWR